jgi:BirA family biotin operon repressor/biotin-[acetyl-CoA-carboxylase] ligase
VRADRQTAGRGRRGRSWTGLEGNLFISGIHHLACSPSEAAQLSFAAALATAEMIDAHIDPARVTLKWPNDVLIDGAKVAGVLLEANTTARGVELVVGVGVNLAAAPQDLDRKAIALSATGAAGADLAAGEAGRALIAAFERWRAAWAADGFAPLRTAWLARAAGLGGPVEVQHADERLAGVFQDLDSEGALVLTTSEGRHHVRAGDVFFGADDG